MIAKIFINFVFYYQEEDAMSESNHNQSFDEADTNTTQGGGSPSTSRASSPASTTTTTPYLPYSPIFGGANNNFPIHQTHIKEEPVDNSGSSFQYPQVADITTPDFRFSQNFFSHFFDRRKFLASQNQLKEGDVNLHNSKPVLEKQVPAFYPATSLPAIIRERLEAAVVASNLSKQALKNEAGQEDEQSKALFKSETDESIIDTNPETAIDSEDSIVQDKPNELSENQTVVENN